MEQTKALAALEPFLALTKSATSPRAAADLVSRATSHPNTFLFAELLQDPQTQSHAGTPEFAPHLALLRIFSFGTYQDYQTQKQPASLPDLNDAQTLKLRQLSLLTLARNRANLTYQNLQAALSLPDVRSLEALVTSAIYAGIISATLDPARQHVRVTALSPLRDLHPGAVPELTRSLQAWSQRCDATLADIDSRMANVRAAAIKRQRQAANKEALLANASSPSSINNTGMPPGAAEHGSMAERLRPQGAGRSAHSRATRMNKRGSNLMDRNESVNDEAMDVDAEADDAKKSSRRKM